MGTQKYKAVLLDFYGTLVEEDTPIIERVVSRIAAESRLGSAPEDISRSWWSRFTQVCADAYGGCFRAQRALERESLVSLLAEFRADLDADELSSELFRYWRAPAAYPSAGKLLASLRVPTCIVSNIDDSDLAAAIAWHGWRFDRIVTSQQCKSYKPRPEPFLRALDLLSLRPTEVIHVGDSLTSDVLGAAGVGIDSVWVNRGGRGIPEGTRQPTYTVGEVGEILPLVE